MNEIGIDAQLDDAELLAQLRHCVREERGATARLLAHLGEVDARGLYRDEGFSSMFEYLVRSLHMSESEAGLRIRVARLGRRFPAALEMLARGELHLTALRLLAPVLTHENEHLLADARFMSKEQVSILLASHAPQPDVPTLIRRLPSRSVEHKSASTMLAFEGGADALGQEPAEPQPRVPARVAPSTTAREHALASHDGATTRALPTHSAPQPSATRAATPLRADRFKVQFTADQQLRDKLEIAEHLLRHQIPNGDVAAIIERALDLLIAQRKKQLFGETPRPRAARTSSPTNQTRSANHAPARHHAPNPPACTATPEPQSNSRYIPRAVRRAVIARDGTQCSFVGADGRRCPERSGLEFHHEQPYALGGAATLENIRVLCKAHNALMAERDFGRTFIVRRRTSTQVPEPVERGSWPALGSALDGAP